MSQSQKILSEQCSKKTDRELLKNEIKNHEISYLSLSNKLKKIGVSLTENEVKHRIHYGYISTKFLMQCLYVIGVNTIDLGDILKEKNHHDV